MATRPPLRFYCLALLGLLVAAGCGAADGPPEAGAGGPMPAMPVEIATLAPVPVEHAGEYVGTVKSRQTSVVQPQVEGFLTRIAVSSGSRVTPGTLLFEIDSTSQAAAVAALESTRAAREADLAWARQQADRTKKLFDAGAASQQELDQTAIAVRTGEAQLRAVEAQIRQQRNELAYYRVTASTAGVIGDVPVRQGDRVTPSTALTTIEDNRNLEAYINVPVQEAHRLRPGLTIKLVDDSGGVIATEQVYFVSNTVDSTQTVLAKARIGAAASRFRSDQFIRARVVWSESQSLVVPLAAVTRIGGRFFVYVAQAGDGGALTAQQRAVTLGDVVGNNYVVLDGLQAGERLITGGIQKIFDGAPVTPAPPSGPAGRQGGGGQ